MTAAPSLFDNDRVAAVEALHSATAIYTMDDVVRPLLERLAWPDGDKHLVDPSAGNGAFLCVALRMLLHADATLIDTPRRIATRLSGWEIHPGAAGEARSRLASILCEQGASFEDAAAAARGIVTTGDFLLEGPTAATYDVIAGNPPYLRYANIPTLLCRDYRLSMPEYAQLDLLHSFLDRCARALRPGGEVAFVSSDRWLFNASCAALREELGRTLSIAHVRRLDATTAFYRPKSRRAGTPARVHPVEVILRRDGATTLGAAPVYPDDLVTHDGRPLDTIAAVRVAPWVGPQGVFLLNAAEAAGFDPRELVPAIDTDDLLPDGSVRAPSRCVLRTSPGVRPSPAVLAHLEARWHLLPPRAQQRRTSPWLPPERVDMLDLQYGSLVIPRIARSVRVYRVAPGIVPINHNLTVIRGSSEQLDVLEAALAASSVNEWVCARAARLENRFFSITTNLLRAAPIAL